MRRLSLLVAVAMLALSCGGGGGEGTDEPDGGGDSLAAGADESGGEFEALGPFEADVGSVPEFAWTSIEGAELYRLAVLGPTGPIWAWEGSATSVNLGGLTGPRPIGMPGPVVVAGTSWSVVAFDTSGDVVGIVGPIAVAGPAPTPATSGPPTTSGERVAEDLPDPCALVSQQDVDNIFGQAAPIGEPGDVSGPGGVSGGRSCRWSQGFSAVHVAIFVRPGFLTPTSICDYCEPVNDVGDEAWAGVSDLGSGGALLAISVDGLGVQVSADGLGATVQQLTPIASSVIAGLS